MGRPGDFGHVCICIVGSGMLRTTVLLSASRFGGSYFLDILGRVRPDDLVLQDIFRRGGASLGPLSEFLGLPQSEIGEMATADPMQLWQLIRAASARESRHVIAKVYYYHLPRDSALWSELSGSRVVHMIRRNLLEAYLSRMQAEQNKLWQTNDASKVKDMNSLIDIDPKKAQRFITERREQISWARRRFSAADYHEIAYEDVAAGPMRCKRAVKQIFGDDVQSAVSASIKSGRVRLKRFSNADVIRNYGEVVHLDRPYS